MAFTGYLQLLVCKINHSSEHTHLLFHKYKVLRSITVRIYCTCKQKHNIQKTRVYRNLSSWHYMLCSTTFSSLCLFFPPLPEVERWHGFNEFTYVLSRHNPREEGWNWKTSCFDNGNNEETFTRDKEWLILIYKDLQVWFVMFWTGLILCLSSSIEILPWTPLWLGTNP